VPAKRLHPVRNGLKYSENDPPPELKERPRSPQSDTGNGDNSSRAPYEPKDQPEDAFKPVRLGNLLRKPAPARRWLVPDWIPAGQVTLLSGDGGIGESMLTLQLATAVATGTDWLGLPVAKSGRVAALSAEDDIDEMHFRFECIVRDLPGEQEATLQALNNVWLIDASKDLDPTLAGFDGKSKRLLLTDTLAKLQAFVAENAIEVLIFDSAADVFSEEIDRYGVRSFIRLIRGLADTVILLGHPSVSGMKDGRGYSGSTHWNNSVRSRLVFTRATDASGNEPDPDLRFLEVAKSNRSKAKQKLSLGWTATGFVRDDKAASGLDKLARQLKAEDVFLRLLQRYWDQGRAPSPNVSNSFAPKLFADDPDSEGISKDEFKRAMNTLLGCKKIEIVAVKKGRDTRERLKPVENWHAVDDASDGGGDEV
jgi:RecA-family ATPase